MNVFSKLIGRSPLLPIIEHGRKVDECVSRSAALFTLHFGGGDREKVVELAWQVSDLEKEANQIRNTIHKALSGKFLT
ncbi:MAG: DUF47 family protein [Akkermansiaceae bacterium]